MATNYKLFAFGPPDSLVCDESEEESLISGDDEVTTEREIKIDTEEVKKMDPRNGVKKKKCGKRTRCESEYNAKRRRKEELRREYKRQIHAYKTKYKTQRIKQSIPMKENAEM